MNVVELIRVLQNKIETATSAEDLLFLTRVMQRLDLGLVRTVSTYTELFNIPSKDTLGEVYFVENEERLYFRDLSNGSLVWKTISGNLNETAAYAWGSGARGQLGDISTSNRSSPVSAVGGFTDWNQISAGDDYTLGLRSNGGAYAWGEGTSGQLGNNTAVSITSPVSVVGGFTDWEQLSGGGQHSLGLRSNGTAWSWGAASLGRLGDNTTVNQSSPVSVVGGFTDWTQLSAGHLHGLGLRENGSIWSWGFNGSGRLGDGTGSTRSSPVSVVGGYTDWIQASGGGQHSLGLRANGTAWAWGLNGSGQLGDGTGSTRSSPVSVAGGFTDWTQVSAARYHSLGIRANGTLWSWGDNQFGGLGDNTVITKSSPVSVVGGFTDWIQASGNFKHSLGLRVNGTTWAWGSNSDGRLGDNTTINRSSPVSVVGGFVDWIQIETGTQHSIAIKTL